MESYEILTRFVLDSTAATNKPRFRLPEEGLEPDLPPLMVPQQAHNGQVYGVNIDHKHTQACVVQAGQPGHH